MTVSSYPKPAELMRRFAPVALAAVLSITATACQTTSPTETTGSFAMASPPPGEADWRRSADAWGERYRANPNDPEAAINYAQALRGNGQRAQAVAVLEQASLHNPKHTGVLGAYGRALADSAITSRLWKSSIERMPPTSLIGASSRYRERSSIRWAGMRRPSATMRRR